MLSSPRYREIAIGDLLALLARRDVAILPNNGNPGDALIHAAALQVLDRAGVRARIVPGDRGEKGDVLLVGGGGNLVDRYDHLLLKRLSLHDRFEEVVILPHDRLSGSVGETTDTFLYFAALLVVSMALGATHLFLASEAELQESVLRGGRVVRLIHLMYSAATQRAISAWLEPRGVRYGSLTWPLHSAEILASAGDPGSGPTLGASRGHVPEHEGQRILAGPRRLRAAPAPVRPLLVMPAGRRAPGGSGIAPLPIEGDAALDAEAEAVP
jgi:hypothetical protein